MTDVSQILSKIESGDSDAVGQLLPLVYEALRRLANRRLSEESPDHTLQPTALVHEAFLKLVHPNQKRDWRNRNHFFAAAAEAMRRILVDHARQKLAIKRGGQMRRVDISDVAESGEFDDAQLMALDEALRAFEKLEPAKATIVKLKFFAGMTIEEAADTSGISRATAQRHWTYARAWLYTRLKEDESQ